MIAVTKLNHTEILLNSDLIEQVEETPDTVIMLTNGHGIRVRETMAQVLNKIVEFRRTIGGQTNPNRTPASLKQGYNFHGQLTEDRED
jgi:flagellar protein FlbD